MNFYSEFIEFNYVFFKIQNEQYTIFFVVLKKKKLVNLCT